MKRATDKRNHLGVITAVVGLALNLLLGAVKLVLGILTGSVAIMGDAVNNLTDVGTGVVTVGSFAIAGKKADREHPYGHGRFEYVATLVISIVVIIVGAELMVTSVKKLVGGADAAFTWTAFIILLASVAIKLVQGVMYAACNKKLKSDTIKAAMIDSFSDCFVTFTVALAFFVNTKTSFPVEAVCGMAAAALIAFTGGKLIYKTVNKLLGTKPDPAIAKALADIAAAYPQILGLHDLKVHDYGAGFAIASVDVEIDSSTDFITVHRIVDEVERAARKRLNVSLVVHPDPVFNTDPDYLAVRRAVVRTLEPYEKEASFHELSYDRENKTVSVHLRLSEGLMPKKEQVLAEIMAAVADAFPGTSVTAQYDFM